MLLHLRLRPWLASLLGLGWLIGVSLPGVQAGGFRVLAEPARDPRAAALRQHPQVAQALHVWTAVVTEFFVLPVDVTVTLAPCGRIDAFYSPARRQIHLCEELLTYYVRVLTPPGPRPTAPASVVRDATLFTFLHLVGHALLEVLDLPVTVTREEAADAIGAVFLVAGSAEDERTVRAGSEALFQRSRAPEPPQEVPWWTLHPWTDQRLAHLRCLLAGSHPPQEATGLDDTTALPCREAWQGWQTLLAPYLRLSAVASETVSPAPAAPTLAAPPPVMPAPDAAPRSPEESLRAYYDALNERHYTRTWLLLAPQFKQTHFCCENDGSFQFQRYRAWWERVARVEVLDAHVQERQPQAVVVRAIVRYVMHSGTVTKERHLFRLVEDPTTRRWLIADQTRGVLQPRTP